MVVAVVVFVLVVVVVFGVVVVVVDVVVLVAGVLSVVCSALVVHGREGDQILQMQSADCAFQLGKVDQSFKGLFAESNVMLSKATWLLLPIQIDEQTEASAVSIQCTIMHRDVSDVNTSPKAAARELYFRIHVSANDLDMLNDAAGRCIRYA